MPTNKVVRMYKLTDQNYETYNHTKWKIGKVVNAKWEGNQMCSNEVLHCYSNPYLAVLFNPLHANIQNPRIIEVDCDEIIANDGLKQACKTQVMVKELSLPIISTIQKAEFAIRCAMLQYTEQHFVKWANNWLSGVDRTESAAESAAWSAESAAWSARSAARSAESAAESAAWSAESAARSAESAAESAAWSAARSARSAARSAAWSAARSAAWSAINQRFIQIITDIMER